jgi:hypothetical protein
MRIGDSAPAKSRGESDNESATRHVSVLLPRVLHGLGQQQEAQPLTERALTISERGLAPDRPYAVRPAKYGPLDRKTKRQNDDMTTAWTSLSQRAVGPPPGIWSAAFLVIAGTLRGYDAPIPAWCPGLPRTVGMRPGGAIGRQSLQGRQKIA